MSISREIESPVSHVYRKRQTQVKNSQNRKWADKNSLKQFSWKKITWNYFFLYRSKEWFNTSRGKTWSRGTSSRLLFAVCCKRDSKSLYYRWSGRKSILGLLAQKSATQSKGHLNLNFVIPARANLYKKVKPWRILVVVVKGCHRPNRLLS